MELPEDFKTPQAELGKKENEITPKSPEVETVEDQEPLEQHAAYAESQIDQQSADFLVEGEKMIESSSQSMNISPEALAATRQEQGLDSQLQEVQTEADNLASEAKAEIGAVLEKSYNAEEVVNIKNSQVDELGKRNIDSVNNDYSDDKRKEEKESIAIFKELDTNSNHEITTGFNNEKNLFTVKKVEKGEVVEIYGKKHLVLGFTHSSERKNSVHKIKDLAHTKEISEKEFLEISEKKKKLDEVLKFSNFFTDYDNLRGKEYRAKINEKKEIGRMVEEVQKKIDSGFLPSLGEIQNLILESKQKRKLIVLFNNYNLNYLRERNPYNYLISEERAKAVELISTLVTDGADTMKVDDKERLNALDKKARIGRDLSASETQEMAYLKKKDDRIEKILKPEFWHELTYEPFDPQLELRKIGYFSKDEMSGLSADERLDIKKERLADYKKNLLEQKNKIAEIQMDIEKNIKQNPEANIDELMSSVLLKAKGAKMTEYQIEAFRKGIESYAIKHQAVENNREKYPDDKAFFKVCFGRAPKGDIEIIKGPMSLYFRCHNLEDYALIHDQKFDQNEKLTDDDIKRANLSAGVSISGCNIAELKNCIMAENSLGKPFNESVYIHEERHKINKLFEDEKMKQDLISAMEKSSPNEKKEVLDKYLRAKRESFEIRAKDEILAYLRDGTDLGELKKIILRPKDQGGIYDYYREWYKKTGIDEKDKLIKNGLDEYIINSHFVKIFQNEYSRDVINPAIESVWQLKNQGWESEKILNLMINEPLTKWPKIVRRIEESKKDTVKPEKEKSEKEILWEKKRAEIDRIVDRLGKGIDEKIKEAVTAFSVYEFPTSQSCEGHIGDKEEGYPYPWVEIEAPEPENLEENKEKEKEWIEENLKQQKRIIDLFEEFYQTRQTPFDARLHLRSIGRFGAFRVQSNGAEIMDLLSPEEQKKKMELYRKEMHDLTVFLKEKYL